jgi:hypothetical protein
VLALKESGTSLSDILERALEVKHPKQKSFVFIHCCTILKDVLRVGTRHAKSSK